MECFITWQLEPENSGLFGRKPIINSLLNETNEPKKKEACRATNKVWKQNRGRTPRICVLLEDLSTYRQLWPCLGVAPWLPLTTHRRKSTHMRGKPTAHIPESRLDKPKCDKDFHKPHSSTLRHRRPTHMRGRHLGSKQPRMNHA
ncbi:hypothetical protein PIB30_067190 [Stylosanthes scabra]|uniref:Uncharacterized protein n=1 Tax=Stylosanthes scabra TaxID=79078 RepID=A0ABU6RMI6_9FABA|nr:hypothetical protein [Stylosanthes scabra]